MSELELASINRRVAFFNKALAFAKFSECESIIWNMQELAREAEKLAIEMQNTLTAAKLNNI